MKLRVARHTADLNKIIRFYTEILQLSILGSFEDHAGYNGVFIGDEQTSWHLEFTTSEEFPHHHPDEDDLLVFYKNSREEYLSFIDELRKKGIKPVKAKNPYWEKNGFMFLDPDGFRIVISY